jgi:hypothetical protein
MSEVLQSIARRVVLKAYLDTDHVSAATGKTIAITISKNGGAFGNPSAGATNATEIASGWYYVDLSTTDTGTLGPIIVRGTNADIDDTEWTDMVVKATNGGRTGIPDAAADAAGGLPISDAGGLDLDAKLAATNEVTAARMGALTDWINGGRLDLLLDEILLDTAEIGAAGAGLTNINLPNQTMDIVGNITGNLSGSVGSVTGAVGSVTGAVGSVTGNVGGNVAGSVAGSVGSLTTNNDKTGYALSATGSAALTEGYPALGATGTLPQLLYSILALLSERSIASTTLTTKKLDGSTTAMTHTLDSATTPTSQTRAS